MDGFSGGGHDGGSFGHDGGGFGHHGGGHDSGGFFGGHGHHGGGHHGNSHHHSADEASGWPLIGAAGSESGSPRTRTPAGIGTARGMLLVLGGSVAVVLFVLLFAMSVHS